MRSYYLNLDNCDNHFKFVFPQDFSQRLLIYQVLPRTYFVASIHSYSCSLLELRYSDASDVGHRMVCLGRNTV